MRGSVFKGQLIRQAQIRSGERALDLGCGTGTLTLRLKQVHPDAEVVGLDADPRALRIAEAKAATAGLQVTFDRGMAIALPYPDDAFDRVLSSLLHAGRHPAGGWHERVPGDDLLFLLGRLQAAIRQGPAALRRAAAAAVTW